MGHPVALRGRQDMGMKGHCMYGHCTGIRLVYIRSGRGSYSECWTALRGVVMEALQHACLSRPGCCSACICRPPHALAPKTEGVLLLLMLQQPSLLTVTVHGESASRERIFVPCRPSDLICSQWTCRDVADSKPWTSS